MDYSTQGLHWILELGWDTEKGSLLIGKIRCTLEKARITAVEHCLRKK